MDAYAQRGLILRPPAAAAQLSSLRVHDDEFLQRYAITAGTGERMVVTFRMQLEDSLVFLRGAQFRKEWFLRGITGEPAQPDLPTQPHPQWGPESVVAAQLQAFRWVPVWCGGGGSGVGDRACGVEWDGVAVLPGYSLVDGEGVALPWQGRQLGGVGRKDWMAS